MAGATIDHMVALTVFLAALLLFIGLFNQTIQTAILYQQHRYIASKATNLLDNILLSPGYPIDWGMTSNTPTSFGLQDPEFTQYRLSPFSLMRLRSLTGDPINYTKTGKTYSNITMGFGDFLFVPYSQVVNYSTVATLLGTNGSYGFQLNIAPVVSVAISEFQSSNPLILNVSVSGKGFPLSNAIVSYCFLTADLQGSYPSYTTTYGSTYTDENGRAFLPPFTDVTDDDIPYALIVYARLSGLIGLGYHQRVTSGQQYVIPLIDDFEERRVLIAHSYDVHYFGPPEATIFYNVTFVLLTEDFTLREMPIENSTGKVGKVNYDGTGPFIYGNVTIPTTNPGILVITYSTGNEGGIILMPWGISSMAFEITFGDEMFGREWVATDVREVIVNDVAYQAKLALWSLQGYRVIS